MIEPNESRLMSRLLEEQLRVRLLYTVADVARVAGRSDSQIRQAIRRGELRAVRIGRLVRIPHRRLASFIAPPAGEQTEESVDDSPVLSEMPRSSRTYFIQAGTDGPIKIGTTADVARRLSTLQTANSARLRILLDVEGSVLSERELHARFQAHRLQGEWFSPCPELLDLIASRRSS